MTLTKAHFWLPYDKYFCSSIVNYSSLSMTKPVFQVLSSRTQLYIIVPRGIREAFSRNLWERGVTAFRANLIDYSSVACKSVAPAWPRVRCTHCKSTLYFSLKCFIELWEAYRIRLYIFWQRRGHSLGEEVSQPPLIFKNLKYSSRKSRTVSPTLKNDDRWPGVRFGGATFQVRTQPSIYLLMASNKQMLSHNS